MAVDFQWHRGTKAALAEAIRELDARLAAVEALTAPGTVVSATAVLGTAAIPAHWIQGAILVTAVAGVGAVPTPTVRGAATHSAGAVSGSTAVPTPTVTVV